MKMPKTSWLTSDRYWLVLLATFTISRLATWLYPFDSDHWIFYYVGKHWLSNHWILYLQAWDHKAPLIFAILGGMQALFGGSLLLHRLFMTLVSLLAVGLFYLTAKRFLALNKLDKVEQRARIAALLLAFWANLSQFTNSAVNTENFAILTIILAYYGYLRWRSGDHYKWLLYSGIGLSLTVGLKLNFGLLMLPLIIDFGFKLWRQLKLWPFALLWAAPSLIQILIWASYLQPRQLLGEAWIATVSFNGKYMRAGWSGALSGQVIFLAVLGAGLLFFVPVLVALISNRRRLAAMTITTAAAALIFMAILGTFYSHYYLVAMPLLCLLAGTVWYETVRVFYWQVVMALSLSMSYAVSLKQLQNRFSGPAASDAKNMTNAAHYIDEHTAKTDRVFFDGYGATFYRLADRDSGSRYISASHLLIDYRQKFGYDFNTKFIGDMENSRTKYIIVDLATEDLYAQNTPIRDYFKRHYHVEASLPGYAIWRRN